MGLGILARAEAALGTFLAEDIKKGDPPMVAGPGTVTPVPGVMPWGWRYPYGINYSIRPRSGEPLTFQNLRAIAKNSELIRIAIQLKKEQIRGLDWDIITKPGYDSAEWEATRKRIKDWFRHPDQFNDLNFTDWISQLIEDLLVLDAGVLWWQMDRAGRLIGCSIVDGATIRPVLTEQGYVPFAPLPAYCQVIDGRNHGTYTRDEMLYLQYNPRSDSAYGMSHVEMVMMSAHISMKRQLNQLTHYTEGNMPEHLLMAPPEWSASQIREVQDYLDAYLSGDVAKRHKLKLIPGGSTLKEIRPPDFTVQVDDWLMRIVSAVFGVAPHVLLQRTRTSTKGAAETIEDQQSDIGFDPFKKYLVETFNEKIISDKFHAEGVAFSFLSDKAQAENANLAKAKAMVPVGALGIDELRQSEGKIPLGIPNYIQMANGLLFLTSQVIEDIKSGKVNFIDAGGVPSNIRDAAAQAASGGAGGAQPARGQNKPSGSTPARKAAKSKATKEQKALFDLEIGQLKKVILSDLKNGRKAGKDFKFRFIPESAQGLVRLVSETQDNAEDLRKALGCMCPGVVLDRESIISVEFSLDVWKQADAEYWLKNNGLRVGLPKIGPGKLTYDQGEGFASLRMDPEDVPAGVIIWMEVEECPTPQ